MIWNMRNIHGLFYQMFSSKNTRDVNVNYGGASLIITDCLETFSTCRCFFKKWLLVLKYILQRERAGQGGKVCVIYMSFCNILINILNHLYIHITCNLIKIYLEQRMD